MKIKRTIVISVVMALILTASSLVAFAANDNGITVRQALDVVMDFMPDCDVESFQRVTNNGSTIYQFTVTDGGERYVIIVDATSGDIESYTRESVSSPQAYSPQTTAPVTPTTPTMPTAPAMPTVPATPGNPNNQTQANTGADSAQSAALARVGGGTVARVETHNPPHVGTEYKVIIVYGDYRYCVHVSGYNSTVTDMHSEQIVRIGPNASNSSAAISPSSAMSTAVQNAGGGVVTECTLEHKPHNGALIYHIHVAYGQYEYCVEISAATGAVNKVEQRLKP